LLGRHSYCLSHSFSPIFANSVLYSCHQTADGMLQLTETHKPWLVGPALLLKHGMWLEAESSCLCFLIRNIYYRQDIL
jgi:hypothetical protein